MIEKKEFITIVFDSDDKSFLVYIKFFASYNLEIEIYHFYKSQIAFFVTTKTLVVVLF